MTINTFFENNIQCQIWIIIMFKSNSINKEIEIAYFN